MEQKSLSVEQRLRTQRDRFVAFAFAGGDVLFELDGRNRILYAAGATEAVHGQPAEHLLGHDVLGLVWKDDLETLIAALDHLRASGRLDRISLRFVDGAGKPCATLISGLTMAGGGEQVFLSVARLHGVLEMTKIDVVTRVVDKENFATLAERRIAQSRANGDDYKVTLLDLSGSDLASMQPAKMEEFLDTVETHLRAWSVAGDSVGRLDSRMFGMVHDASVRPDSINRRVVQLADRFEADSGQLRAATMDLKSEDLSPEDVTKAVAYTLNKFVEDGGYGFGIKTLSEAYKESVADTLARVTAFRGIINSDKLIFVYQPIIDLQTWDILRYECLARVIQGDRFFLPSQFVTFAEDLGVVSELDGAVVRRAMEILSAIPETRVGVNISGTSFNKPAFIGSLFQTIKNGTTQASRLCFEISEWDAIKNFEDANVVVQGLRALGCTICMDDFEPTQAALHFLKRVDVDTVKIDGAVVREGFDTRHGLAFLKATTALCREMGIRTIGEMVEDERTVRMLREIGVDDGQGYYFSKPVAAIGQARLPPRV